MPQNYENLTLPAEIKYTSIPEAVAVWEKDPYGQAVFDFLQQVYSITDVPAVLQAAGMEEYLRYKNEGRLVLLHANQILKPSFYNLTSIFMAGEMAKNGLPIALMVFEYPQDIFLTRNQDKKEAFGWQEFYLNEKESVKINIQPSGLKSKPFPIRTIDAASNHPCDQIMVQVAGQGQGNMAYPSAEYALGLNFPEETSVTDFHKTLWKEAVSRLRRQGILPDEDRLPMFFVDMVGLYSTIAQASPAFNYQRRMLSSAEYYPLQVAWPDLYLEDSGGTGQDFETMIISAQSQRYHFGLPEVQVRVPYREVQDLDKYCLHPTGRVADFNLNPAWRQLDDKIRLLANQMPKLPPEQEGLKIELETKIKALKEKPETSQEVKALTRQIPRLSRDEKELKGQLGNQIKQLRIQQEQLPLSPKEYIREVPFSLPPTIEEVYNNLWSGAVYAV